jgi:excisionase family DNA binding protein
MLNPLAVTVAEACHLARSSRSEIYAAILRGELGARKRGRKTLILMADLRAWVEALPEFKTSATTVGEAS